MLEFRKRDLIKACYYPSVFLQWVLPVCGIQKWVLIDHRLWNIIVSSAMLEALYKNGRTEFSELLVENLTTNFVNRKKFIPDYREKYLPAKQVNSTFTVSFRYTLQLFLEVVYPLGLKPFLAFGTLLGHEREGAFLPWDLDIDLGIIDEDTDFQDLIDAIKKSPFKILECSVNKYPYKIKCGLKGAPVVELIIFKKEADFFLTYAEIMELPVKRKRTQFTLKKSSMDGLDVYIPADPNLFLTENYGDWQNPRTIYHYLFDSKLTDFNSCLVRFYAKKYFYELLSNGNHEKVRYYLHLFERKFPEEQLWKKIKDKLISQLP
jgi:hypothetical protein